MILVSALLLSMLSSVPDGGAPAPRQLRVCADPNNLPFSNDKGEGFENKIAELLARELEAELRYTWWAQRRGFFRNTLSAGLCDVVIGVPTEVEFVLPTRPYYRSSYAFVFPKGKAVTSFDDPRLRTLRIGVPLVGDDGANPPPVTALSRRGIIDNVVGYSVTGDYRKDSPPAEVVRAVGRGEVDVAIAWGPLAGFYARQQSPPLELSPISAIEPGAPFSFDISMGVRKKDRALKAELERVLTAKRAEIDRILDGYGVPRTPRGGGR